MLDFDPNAAPDADSGVFGLPHQEKDAALVLVTHDLGVVAHLCDRVAVMQQGSIVDTLDSALLAHGATHPYTKTLVDATRSYTRLPAAGVLA